MERRAPAPGAGLPPAPGTGPGSLAHDTESGARVGVSAMMKSPNTSKGRPPVCLTTFFKKLLRLTSPVKAVQINTDPLVGRTVVIDVKPRARGLQCGECGRRCSRRHGAEGKLNFVPGGTLACSDSSYCCAAAC